MNSRTKKIAVVAAAGVAVVLVLTACTRIVNNRLVVGEPNGIPVQTQSINLEQAAPAEQNLVPAQRAPEQAPVIAAPATTIKAEEKSAAPVLAAAETAKAAEQMQLTEKAAAQTMHHCSGFDD